MEGGLKEPNGGILEKLSQNNDNTKNISNEIKFKFIYDRLTFLEKINIFIYYNFKSNVASDIPANGYYIDNLNLERQDHLNKISDWTLMNKMVLNKKKSNAMLC